MTDPKTGEQRGCNACWEVILETLGEFIVKVPDDLEPEPIEIEDIDDYLKEDLVILEE